MKGLPACDGSGGQSRSSDRRVRRDTVLAQCQRHIPIRLAAESGCATLSGRWRTRINRQSLHARKPLMTGRKSSLTTTGLLLGSLLLLPRIPCASSSEDPFTSEQRGYWAFQKVVRPEVPAVRQQHWIRNAIDAFVLARLEAGGIFRLAARRPHHLASPGDLRLDRASPDAGRGCRIPT